MRYKIISRKWKETGNVGFVIDVVDHIRTRRDRLLNYFTHVLEILPRVQDIALLVDIVGRSVGHPGMILVTGFSTRRR